MAYEEQLERKIKGGLLGLKNGTKTPQEVAPWLNRLKEINPLLFQDYINDYKAIIKQKGLDDSK